MYRVIVARSVRFICVYVRARICVCIVVSFDAEQILSFVEYTQSFLVLYFPTHHTRSFSTLRIFVLSIRINLLLMNSIIYFLSTHDLINITYDVKMIRVSSRTVRAKDFLNFVSENFLCDCLMPVNGMHYTEMGH